MTRIIIGATSAPGHVFPMLSVASDLIRRGHEVSFLTGEPFKDAVEKTGAVFEPFQGAADIDPAALSAPERLALEGLDQLNYDLQHFVVGTIADQYASLQRVLAQFGDDEAVVLAESGFGGIVPALVGVPGVRAKGYAVLGVTPLTLSSIDTAPMGMGLEPDSSEEGRARNIAQNAFMKDTLFGPTQKLYEELLTSLGATDEIPFFFDTVAARADSFMQLSVEELSYKRSDLPETVHFIGALPTPASVDAQLPEWWSDVVAAETVVVVTQGTIANSDFGDLIQPTLEALADLPVLVVAATGSPEAPATVPANARIAQFVPFVDLLPQTSVLVTNGGYGGTQQALSFGVPLVLAGETEDKIEGNARTAYTGAAINLKTQRPTPDAIREAVQRVLSESSFVANARRLQDEYAALDPYAAIADTVARLDAR